MPVRFHLCRIKRVCVISFFISLKALVQTCPIPDVDREVYSLFEREWSYRKDVLIRQAEHRIARKLTEKECKIIIDSCENYKKQNIMLEKAVRIGDCTVLKSLLSSGVSPNRLVRSKGHKRSKQAWQVRSRMDDPMHRRIVLPLEEGESYTAYVSLLEIAIAHNHRSLAVALLKAGVHCNTFVHLSETALVHALAYNDELVPILLNRGARMPTRCELFDLSESERILLFSHAQIAQQRQNTITRCLQAWEVPDVLIGVIVGLEGSIVRHCPVPSYNITKKVTLPNNRMGLKKRLILCNNPVGTIYELVHDWCQRHDPPHDEPSYVMINPPKRSLSLDEHKAIRDLLGRLQA